MLEKYEVVVVDDPEGDGVAGTQGFEPRYADPESAVLPLDDLPTAASFYQTVHGRIHSAPRSKLKLQDAEVFTPVRPGVGVRLRGLGR